MIEAETARQFRGVELELHAQDKDREASGWAAVPKGISDKRLKMRLVDGVSPNELWGRDQIYGDVHAIVARFLSSSAAMATFPCCGPAYLSDSRTFWTFDGLFAFAYRAASHRLLQVGG